MSDALAPSPRTEPTRISEAHGKNPVELSVVIVNWNTRELLRDCLASVFAESTKLQLEVFVADNASTDGSIEMARGTFPQVHLIENQTNLGFAAANNRVFPLCHADKVLLLNSDTVVKGGALRALVEFLDKHSDVAAVAPKLEQSNVDIIGCGRQLSLRTAFNHWLFLARMFPRARALEGLYYYRGVHDDKTREVDWVSGACMMVRRSVIEQVGPLSEQWFMYAEDQEWSARIRQRGWKIYHLPEAIVEHRHGASFEQNPEVSVLPHKANRDLFVHLSKPSRAKLFAYDLVVVTGLVLRAFGDFLRGIVGQPQLRALRRNRARKFFSDAKAIMRCLGAGTD